jgi:hypothetical protein
MAIMLMACGISTHSAATQVVPDLDSQSETKQGEEVATTYLIPAKAALMLEFVTETSSKTAVSGDKVDFLLAEDLIIDGVVVLKKGNKAFGEVIHAQKSGFGGRGGELIIGVRSLDVDGQVIPLRSLKPIKGQYIGQNNSDTAFAVSLIPYAGLASLFITGGEIVLPAGTRAIALVASETAVVVKNVVH